MEEIPVLPQVAAQESVATVVSAVRLFALPEFSFFRFLYFCLLEDDLDLDEEGDEDRRR